MTSTTTKSILDLPPDHTAEARLDAQSEAEIDAGKGVPHQRVREWLRKLASGQKLPPPEA
jgi:hypothetical protein